MVGAATRERLFNDYVLNLQYGLRILCSSPGSPDGVFGAATEAAVKKFQAKYSLPETGIVNDNTWHLLKDKIRAIQEQLNKKDFLIARIDGLATSALVETIKQFQEDNLLTADGQVGPSTFDIFFSYMESGASDVLPLKVGKNKLF